MEGVGARLGRSSSRYSTTTVFSGPVRKWKKKWVTVAPPPNHPPPSLPNAPTNAPSHLLLFKWTPISHRNKQNNNNDDDKNSIPENNSKDDDSDSAPEPPPKRKFRYIPVAALEEQKRDTEENTDDEVVAVDDDSNAAEQTSKNDVHDEKPNINDVPMEENQDETASERQDLNESATDQD